MRRTLLTMSQLANASQFLCWRTMASNQDILPNGYMPNRYDILCGRARENYYHEGNVWFRNFVESNLGPYLAASSKTEKSEAIAALVSEIQGFSPSGGFIKRSDGRWFRLSDTEARDKVGHAVRKAIEKLQQTQPQQLDRMKRDRGQNERVLGAMKRRRKEKQREKVISLKTPPRDDQKPSSNTRATSTAKKAPFLDQSLQERATSPFPAEEWVMANKIKESGQSKPPPFHRNKNEAARLDPLPRRIPVEQNTFIDQIHQQQLEIERQQLQTQRQIQQLMQNRQPLPSSNLNLNALWGDGKIGTQSVSLRSTDASLNVPPQQSNMFRPSQDRLWNQMGTSYNASLRQDRSSVEQAGTSTNSSLMEAQTFLQGAFNLQAAMSPYADSYARYPIATGVQSQIAQARSNQPNMLEQQQMTVTQSVRVSNQAESKQNENTNAAQLFQRHCNPGHSSSDGST